MLQAKSKAQTDVLNELFNTDGMALNAKTETKMQEAMDQVSQACDNYDLTVRLRKIEIVYQPTPGKP